MRVPAQLQLRAHCAGTLILLSSIFVTIFFENGNKSSIFVENYVDILKVFNENLIKNNF